MINKKLYFGMIFIFGILIFSSFVFAYVQTSYSPAYNNAMGIGLFSSGQSLKMDESMCQQGTDFLIQIGPLGCTPSPVTSDLLAEENVNVFCQLTAIQINPFIDVQRIDSIGFQTEYPKEVVGIGYQAAQAALGYNLPVQAPLGYNPTNTPLEGSLTLQNLGYVVFTLKKQPNESALTNCKKNALGSQICWVNGNLTANIAYNVQNIFGVGQALFYLPVMDDAEWQRNYIPYEFWDGRGYLRADSVGDDNAVLSVYSDNTVASSLLPAGRTYNLAKYSSNIALKTGETSNKIFLPGLSPCLASLQLKLVGVVNPDTRAVIKVNEDYTEVAERETFLDGKCTVSSMTKKGVTSEVSITCSGADSSEDRKPFLLIMSPRVNLDITKGTEKDYGVGDFLYQSADKTKNVYLGYVGSTGEASDPSKLFVTLVSIPINQKDGSQNKLTDDEIASVASYAETAMASSANTGTSAAVNFLVNGFNGFTGVMMKVGKAVLLGTNFANVPYRVTLGGTGYKNFEGTDVSLEGFASAVSDGTFPSNNQNYTNAMSDFDTVVNNYPNEVEKANSIQTLGEAALYEEIKLTDILGMKKKLISLCKEFTQNYPNSNFPIGTCTNSLSLSNQGVSTKSIIINGVTKIISFTDIKEPSINDYSAELVVQGPNGNISYYTLEKNKMIQLTGFRNDATDQKNAGSEYIMLKDLSTTSATVMVHAGIQTIANAFVSENKVFNKGAPQTGGGYTFTLRNVNLKKVAEVSIVVNKDFAKSNSSFTFNIGIEKRLIQLSPEQAKQKIIEQNKTIATEKTISKYLNGVVTAMKGACVATEAILLVKNLNANRDGKAIARQKIMAGAGGWNDLCAAKMKSDPKAYKSLNGCFLTNSDKIEKDVNAMASAIKTLPGTTNSNDSALMKKYSNSVGNLLNSFSGKLPSDKLNKIENILNSQGTDSTTASLISKGAYTEDDLNNIQLYAAYLTSGSRSGDLDSSILEKLNSTISDVIVNSDKYMQIATTASKLNIDASKIIPVSINKETKNLQYLGSTKKSDGSVLPNSIADNTPIAILQTDIGAGSYILLLDNHLGSKLYPVLKKDISKVVDGKTVTTQQPQIYDMNGNLVEDTKITDQLANFQFTVTDASSYQNIYVKSYGDTEPLLTYYESLSYKGRVAVVPFDLKNGWYAGVQNPASVYDASGKINEFYICNVGADGIESFQITTPEFGGDNCQLIIMSNRATGSTILGLDPSTSNKLVSQAVAAINYAQTKYTAGMKVLKNIPNVNIPVKVGKPADEITSKQCTDLWPVQDCTTLFNVCDPVVCPSSRCNLGGNYNVKNVIQSGIVGSIALCYPNAKWNGGDVYVPFCISGLNAGLEAWISVQQAYVDCLQKNVDTGETVGICDEKNSIYMCQFFWSQSLPIIKLMVPKIINKITGQNSVGKGGGEYQSFSSALKSAQASIDYFTQYYAANSNSLFKAPASSATDQAEAALCGNFISAVYPGEGSFFDRLLSPASPVQFYGKFEETVLTTTTNPPTSHYKVYYHIYAGTDYGVYYTVYLKGSGSSYYQDTSQNRNVKSGYIEKGGYADETPDFTAPSGYTQLCINVNGQETCGFKEVSTSFGVNYLSDLYVKDQATNTSITTADTCVSGTASVYSLLNLNIQSAATNLLNPNLAAQGITRTCATQNPGAGTDSTRWVQVGYCGDKAVGCWIDTVSVKNAITALNLQQQALDTITGSTMQYLNGNYMTADQFNAKINDINAIGVTNQQKIDMITAIFNQDQAFYNNQKAQLFLLRGESYARLAKVDYDVFAAAAKAKAEADAAKAAAAAGEINRLNSFNAKYLSPEFLLNDGNILTPGDICYRYYNSVWQWAVGCDSVVSKVTWNDVDAFDGDTSARAKSVHAIFKEVIHSLQGQNGNYFGGLQVLVDKVIANKAGRILDDSTIMDGGGVFTVKFSDATISDMETLNFKYDLNLNGWVWITNKDYIGLKGAWQSVSSIVPELNYDQKTVMNLLNGKDFYQGAAILLDYSSQDIKDIFIPATTPGSATTVSLESLFAKRDVDTLTTLMNSLSTSVSTSNLMCSCGTNCGDYAKWITEASGENQIPDELLLLAIMIEENSCKSSESSGGDLGLMQINPIHCGTKGLSSDLTTCKSTLLNDNLLNIQIGAQVLEGSYTTYSKTYNCNGANIQSYSGWEAALRGYNGWGGTNCGNINYVQEVEAKYYQLVNLYNSIPGTNTGTTTCTVGQTKCDGTTWYTCVNSAWVSQGQVDGKCTYTAPTGVCTAPQPYSEVASLTDPRQRVLFAATALDGTPALKGSVIKDYDLSGGVNCFDSTVHVYDKAGVTFHCSYSDSLGKAYTSDSTTVLMGSTKNSNGNVIFSINPNTAKCNLVGLSESDKLNNINPGDMLSIVWNPTAGHDVIFIKWINENSHTNAQVFDWIGGFGYKTYDLSDGAHSVYMYWSPVI